MASLTSTLYRAMLRSSRAPAVRHSRFELPLETLPESVQQLARRIKPGRHHEGLAALIRAAWREGAVTSGDEAKSRIDDAFRCLRSLGELHEECEQLVSRRIANADRNDINFCVGEVLRHKKFGFRAVVVGWDRRPEVDVSDWDGVAGLPSGGEQPFYRVLPDISDCIDLLGGPRDMRYVAQENLERMPLAHRRIKHPRITSTLFRGFDPASGRWVPSVELAFQYPGSLTRADQKDGNGPLAEVGEALVESASNVVLSVRRAAGALAGFVSAAAAREAAAADTDAAEAAAAAEARLVPLFPDANESDMVRSAAARLGPGKDMLSDLRKLLRRAEASTAGLCVAHDADGAARAAQAAAEVAAEAAEAAAGAAGSDSWSEEDEYDDEDDEFVEVEEDDDGSLDDDDDDASIIVAAKAASSTVVGGAGRDEALVGGAYRSLRQLLKVGDYLQTNRNERAKKTEREGIHFHIGQVLRHKKFGFRAVVFGWEGRPHLDVSNWDGVIDLPSGPDQPFYRMIPDQSDCVDLLGGPRGVRYVAQENLEILPTTELAHIHHELLPHFFRAYDPHVGAYVPVQQLSYWYPLDAPPAIDAGGGVAPVAPSATEEAGGGAHEVVTSSEGVAAEARSAPVTTTPIGLAHNVDAMLTLLRAHLLDAARERLLDSALPLLAAARNGEEAQAAERTCRALLAAHTSPRVVELADEAELLLETDDLRAALATLDQAVALDANHADTYTRRAAVHVKAGRYRRALADATRALELEPRHFEAMRWKGAALRFSRKYAEAIEAFEATLDMHP